MNEGQAPTASLAGALFEHEARQLDKHADVLDTLNGTAADTTLAAEAKAYRAVAKRLRDKARTNTGSELVGAAEIAALLDVSTTRVRQLLNRTGAPTPVADLAAGKIYLAADIRRFLDGWTRKPGRPRSPSTGCAGSTTKQTVAEMS